MSIKKLVSTILAFAVIAGMLRLVLPNPAPPLHLLHHCSCAGSAYGYDSPTNVPVTLSYMVSQGWLLMPNRRLPNNLHNKPDNN